MLALLCLFQQLGNADAGVLGMWISSDTLYPVNVFTDVFRDHYSIWGWYFAIAPHWFPDLAATGLFWLITHNVILATLLAGFIQIPLIVAAFHLIAKAIGVYSRLQDVFVLCCGVAITLFVAVHAGLSYPALYQFFLPQTHVGSMVAVLYGWAMALWLVAQPGAGRMRWIAAAYAALCFLAGMSNILFFPHMLAPLTAACAAAVFFGVMTARQCVLPVAVGWPAAAAGAVANRMVFRATDVSAQAGFSYDRVLTSLDVFMRGFAAKALAHDTLHLIAMAWVAVCTAYLAWTLRALIVRGRSTIARPQILTAVFLLMCVLSAILSGASIILGGSNGLAVFKDYAWSMHYMHSAFLLPLFGMPAIFCWISQRFIPGKGVRVAALTAAAGALIATGVRVVAQSPPATPIYAYRPPLVRFMDEIAERDRLHYGYAGYWQARLITLLSRSGLRAYAVDGSMNPLLWANNAQWYSQSVEDRSRRPHIDFVVLDDPLWKLSREAAVRVFGEPAQERAFQSVRVLIYSGRRAERSAASVP